MINLTINEPATITQLTIRDVLESESVVGDVGVGHKVGVQVAGGRHDRRGEPSPAVLADQRGIVRLSVTQLLQIKSP